ncbi:MAG: hypothetical protein KatS3mg057_0479 [Herpetosiphonaceae bacterium]|nr:MAG: hypothetical protein KatS3mg057_0479 [Herpetosiphonaceae bacterium]
MDQATELLNQGIVALRAGKRDEARLFLLAALRANPYSEQAWLWLSAVVDNPAQQRDCLERALAINPASVEARRGLEHLNAQASGHPPAPAPQSEPTPPVQSSSTLTPPPPPPLQIPGAGDLDQERHLAELGLIADQPPFAGLESGWVPTQASLPPPTVAPCYFCAAPDVTEVCPACQVPQSYDCPSCGLPIDLRISESCKCGESLRPFLRAGGIDHERLGDRYLKQRYVAAAIKQWELALPQAAKPQNLHKKLANAYIDVGLIEKAREHMEAAKRR